MHSQLQKAIDLVKKTGDRLIVFDSAKSSDVYVVMSLKDYENLVLKKNEVRDLTEDELLDKINRDIAIWKSEQELQEFSDDLTRDQGRQFNKFTDKFAFDNFRNTANNTSNIDKIDSETDSEKRKKFGNTWSIPKKIKEAAEEVVEEDRQYYLEEMA